MHRIAGVSPPQPGGALLAIRGIDYFLRTLRVMKGTVNGFDVVWIFLYSSRISRIAL
jgi:hypothetical protein